MKIKKVIKKLKSIIIIIIAILYLLPIIWVVTCSVKKNDIIFKLPPKWIFNPIIDNFKHVLSDGQYVIALINSSVLAISTSIVTVILGSLAAYGLARSKSRRKEGIKFFIISTRMAPALGFLIGYFVIFNHLNILGFRITLFIVYLNINLGFAIWMLISFFEHIPISIEEAAMIDGCSRFRAFCTVVFPLARPGVATTAIFTFIMCWNEFPFALLLTNLKTLTVPVIIPNYLGVIRLEWGQLSAAGILTALPVMIFAMLIQKHLVKGLTFGAVD